jgi:hypothetical protein
MSFLWVVLYIQTQFYHHLTNQGRVEVLDTYQTSESHLMQNKVIKLITRLRFFVRIAADVHQFPLDRPIFRHSSITIFPGYQHLSSCSDKSFKRFFFLPIIGHKCNIHDGFFTSCFKNISIVP